MNIEKWRYVVGWHGLYKVSDQGRVYSTKRKKFVNIRRSKQGCIVHMREGGSSGRVTLGLVHRLVMDAFNPMPPGKFLEVKFRNDDKYDPRLENLVWEPRRRSNMKLCLETAREIRAVWKTGEETLQALGRRYNVSHVSISRIVSNKIYIDTEVQS